MVERKAKIRKMRYIELLLNSNKTSNKKVRLNNGIVRIRIDDELFSGITLKHIAEMINAIHKQYKGIKIPIEFYFGRTAFIDKLTFITINEQVRDFA